MPPIAGTATGTPREMQSSSPGVPSLTVLPGGQVLRDRWTTAEQPCGRFMWHFENHPIHHLYHLHLLHVLKVSGKIAIAICFGNKIVRERKKSRLHAIRQPEKRIVLQLVQNSVRYFQMGMEIKNTPLDCAATRTHSVWHPSKCDLFCVCEANRNGFCRARQNWVKLWLYWRFGGEHLKNKLCFVRDMRTHILVSINIWMTCSTNPWKNNFLAFS